MNKFNKMPMNKKQNHMNKITRVGDYAGVPVRIETMGRMKLAQYWDRGNLTGHFWRLYYNYESGAGVYVKGKKVRIDPERFYLLPPFCNLGIWCDDPEVRQLYIHFETMGIGPARDFGIHELPLTPELAVLLGHLEGHFDGGSGLRNLAAVALAAAAILRLPTEMLILLNRDNAIEKVIDYIRGHFNQELEVEELARRGKMSVNSFLRRFRTVTGNTPYRFVCDLRYIAAVRLLEEGVLSIGEICNEIGLKDRFHFSREFKRRYGQAPGAYRNNRSI